MGCLRRVIAMGLATLAVEVAAPAVGARGTPSPPLRVHVTLTSHQVVAGDPIEGIVVFTNTTHKAITVNSCTTDGWLAVGLSGPVNSYPFFHFSVGCPPSVRIAPGAKRFPVSVITTYAGCVQPQPAGGSSPTPLMPWCTVAGPPPLPDGSYSTKVDIIGLSGLTQAPNRVVVHLRSPKKPPLLAPCADQPGTAPPPVTVPNVVGATSLSAASVLAKVCLNAGYASPVGSSVISEMPAAGSEVPEHSTVTLTTR